MKVERRHGEYDRGVCALLSDCIPHPTRHLRPKASLLARCFEIPTVAAVH